MLSFTLRITLKVDPAQVLDWRLIATRAALRLVRRAIDWLMPVG